MLRILNDLLCFFTHLSSESMVFFAFDLIDLICLAAAERQLKVTSPICSQVQIGNGQYVANFKTNNHKIF